MIGPTISRLGFKEASYIKKYMTEGFTKMGRFQLPVVDVRDVAEAHLQAVLIPEAANKRFILVN